ncbi:hypothetical protein F4818DRAFT_116554 [Hypoxylon cercidicola]|nr:hypothetical protein F4818DRAFT_116554 [Hypoxylon cercidicola]
MAKGTVSQSNFAGVASLARSVEQHASGETGRPTRRTASRSRRKSPLQRGRDGTTGTENQPPGKKWAGATVSCPNRYWPRAFRWTCCGLCGDQRLGCDHHGTGPDPCQCDFCHMGKALPHSVYENDTSERHGLKLSRGPDRRSFNPAKAATADIMRAALGMPE